MIRAYDKDALRRQFATAKPFPFVKIDEFLDPAFADLVAAAYPSFDSAIKQGRTFSAVNERKKVQVTDSTLFPKPVAELNNLLSSQRFLTELSYITGIPNLLADEALVGGGMHLTGPGGRLDVHVDFNLLQDRQLHRRLNLLLYLNPVWQEAWGGHVQFWDENVTVCRESFAPNMNRCVIFETSDISFHGVVPVTAGAPYPRMSFAAYYYTQQAPPNWDGKFHSTVFRARPKERYRKYVLMPAAQMQDRLTTVVQKIKHKAKQIVVGTD